MLGHPSPPPEMGVGLSQLALPTHLLDPSLKLSCQQNAKKINKQNPIPSSHLKRKIQKKVEK